MLYQVMWPESVGLTTFWLNTLTVSISNIPELVLFPIVMEMKSTLLMLLMTKSLMCEMFKFYLYLDHPVYGKFMEAVIINHFGRKGGR